MMRQIVQYFFILFCVAAQAEDSIPPDPLTLDYALEQASAATHYQIIEDSASVEQAQTQTYQAQAASEWQAHLNIRASVFEPSPLATDQSTDEFNALLHIEKLLYDFGRSDLLEQSAAIKQDAVQSYTAYVVTQRRLDITREYLAVLLADLRYTRDDEAMAIAYVQYENVQDKHALQQTSDVDLLAAETLYQNALYQRSQSENNRRSSRARLAEVMNRPEILATNLVRPVFSLQRELSDYNVLLEQAMAANPRVLLLQAAVESTQKKMLSAQYLARPTLNAEVDVNNSSIDRSSRDDWRASLTLRIPLLEQQSFKAQVSVERSQWLLQRAMLMQEQSKLRQQVLSLWQQIPLLTTRLSHMKTRAEYSELYLDRSRALYELEAKTDLGDAMVALTDTRYQQAQVEFELALAWMELDMITQTPVTTR